jgi:antitoxin component YwqK of YwqJK toxin-antitoxin module
MEIEKKDKIIDENVNEEIIKISVRDSLDADEFEKEKKPGCFQSFLILSIGTALSSLPYLIFVKFDLIVFDLISLLLFGWLVFSLVAIGYTYYQENFQKFSFKYSRSNVIQEEGVIRWGKRSGYWYEYYIDGSKKQNSYYVKGELQYVEIFYKTGITKEIINYEHGRKHGFYYKFYENGSMQEICYYSHGLKHGPYHKYFQGLLIEETGYYLDNVLDGFVYRFFENRRVESVERLSNGVWNGRKTEYYEDGLMSSIKDYSNGKLDGIYKEFNEQGTLIYHALYQKGTVLQIFVSN